jgi:hypothetical protein
MANPLRNCGLTPQLLAELVKRGGIDAVRQVVRGTMRSVAKILHPDVSGKETKFYTKFLADTQLVEKASNEELAEFVKKLKQPAEATAAQIIEPAIQPGTFLQSITTICRKGHLPSAREIGFYPLAPPGTEDKMNRKPTLFIIRPVEDGIEWRPADSNEWQQGRNLFFAGSFSREIDRELRSILPWEYRKGLPLLLPGQVIKDCDSSLRGMTINNGMMATIENSYSPDIASSRVLALVNATTGTLLHVGYLYEKTT